MKSEKGITLTSLIVYIILLMLVIGILSTVSNYFYGNLKYVGDMGKYMSEYNKFNMYFVEDVKNNTDVYSIENEKIVFNDGTIYTFDNNNIYRNKAKICDNIHSVIFDKIEETDSNNFTKIIIDVKMVIEGDSLFETENEYVLRYWNREEEIKEAKKTFQNLSPYNYGEYINLGNSLIKTDATTDDWRIFYKEDNKVYVILAEYLPTSLELQTSTELTMDITTENNYSVRSTTSRTDLVSKLNNTSIWKSLLPSKIREKEGITITGTPTIDLWVKSWNAKKYKKLYVANNTDTTTYNAEGYLVGKENPATLYDIDISDANGHDDNLYFPYTNNENGTAYWLASLSANYDDMVMEVTWNSKLNNARFDINSVGIRPIICFDIDKISASKGTNGIWTLD